MTRILPLLAALAFAGCDKADTTSVTPPTRDLGTGLNTVDRVYGRPAAEMVSVVERSLRSLDLKMESEQHDNLGGEAVALRATGQKVTVTTKALDADRCTLSVRVEPGDRNLATLVHDRITTNLLPLEERTRQP